MIGYEILKFPWRPSRAYSSTKSREIVLSLEMIQYLFSCLNNSPQLCHHLMPSHHNHTTILYHPTITTVPPSYTIPPSPQLYHHLIPSHYHHNCTTILNHPTITTTVPPSFTIPPSPQLYHRLIPSHHHHNCGTFSCQPHHQAPLFGF